MPTYLFENGEGEVIELSYSMASCPKSVRLTAEGKYEPHENEISPDTIEYELHVFKKIIAPCQVMLPFWMQAKNDTEVVTQHQMHNEPNPANPGGKSDAQLVKEGVYRTKDMGRWV